MKKMMGIKRLVAKTLCGMMVATMLMGNTAFASELDSEAIVAETETTIEDEETVEAEENAKTEATEVAEVEADTDAEEAAPEAEVEETEAEAEESEESEESKSLEDILGEVDNTASVVEDTVYVDLSLIIPENCILSKDGQVITSFEADILLTDGQITVSQPSAPDYKNRIESDVVISIIDGNISVSFEGQDVVGTVQDSLGNTVSFDGTTLQIVNSDKMESLEPSEVEIDDPDTPLAAPDSYTVRYFVDFVAEENLLHQDVVAGIVGQEIKIDTIDLNAYKPENTEALVWADGVLQDGYATIIVEGDSDIIDIVYTSETVIVDAPADFTVKYYRDALQEGNFLGEYRQGGIAGQGIDFSTIDNNLYRPADYGNGEIQTVVSATVVTEDDSDIVYILYTRVEKEIQIVTETVEIPGETIIVEKPVETIVEKVITVEVPVEVEKIVEKVVEVEKEVVKEVPVEKIVEKEVIVPGETIIIEKEVPGETIVVEKEVIKEVPVEKIVEVPVEKVVTETVFVPVEVEKIVEVEKEIPVDRIVTIPGEDKVVYVEVPTTEIKEVEVIVEKEVPVYVQVPAEDTDNEEATTIEVEENDDPAPETDEDSAPEYTDGPQTGDESPVMVLILVMVFAALGMAVVTKKNAVAR